MHSCIYAGRVAHHRRRPLSHRFTYWLYTVVLPRYQKWLRDREPAKHAR